MLTYEVDSINRSLEDLTYYTCFKAPQEANKTP